MEDRIRQLVIERANGRCEYCQSPSAFSPGDFAVEHIIPRHRGGTDELSNLAWSCQGCNNRKFTAIDAIDPVTSEFVPLYHPRNDSWSEHFQWSDDNLLLGGLTPTGRATIERIQLNRANVCNLRRVLIAVGEHPPD